MSLTVSQTNLGKPRNEPYEGGKDPVEFLTSRPNVESDDFFLSAGHFPEIPTARCRIP